MMFTRIVYACLCTCMYIYIYMYTYMLHVHHPGAGFLLPTISELTGNAETEIFYETAIPSHQKKTY